MRCLNCFDFRQIVRRNQQATPRTRITKVQTSQTMHGPSAHAYALNIQACLLSCKEEHLPASSMWASNQFMASSTPAFWVLMAAFSQRTRGNPMSSRAETMSGSATGPAGAATESTKTEAESRTENAPQFVTRHAVASRTRDYNGRAFMN